MAITNSNTLLFTKINSIALEVVVFSQHDSIKLIYSFQDFVFHHFCVRRRLKSSHQVYLQSIMMMDKKVVYSIK